MHGNGFAQMGPDNPFKQNPRQGDGNWAHVYGYIRTQLPLRCWSA